MGPERIPPKQKDKPALKRKLIQTKGKFLVFLYVAFDKPPRDILPFYLANTEAFIENGEDVAKIEERVKEAFKKDVEEAREFADLIPPDKKKAFLSNFIVSKRKSIIAMEQELEE